MIIDTPDGPKFEWEVDDDTRAASIAATAAAAEASKERVAARQREKDEKDHSKVTVSATKVSTEPAIVDPSLVELAAQGHVAALRARLDSGCTPDVVAFAYDLYPGSVRMYCNDWMPLTAAAAAGHSAVVEILLAALADVNAVCCTTTSSGTYKHWTALDCARTGETIPFERDAMRHLQPRHPEVEQRLLSAGAQPSSKLPEPVEVNTYGTLPEAGQRPNPCLDESNGLPVRPLHLYDCEVEEKRKQAPGAPKLGRMSGGGGCPMTSMGMDPDARQRYQERGIVYTGGSRLYKNGRR